MGERSNEARIHAWKVYMYGGGAQQWMLTATQHKGTEPSAQRFAQHQDRRMRKARLIGTYTADDSVRANGGVVRSTPCIGKDWFHTGGKRSSTSAQAAANECGRRQSCPF
jgi:hypothetical protein